MSRKSISLPTLLIASLMLTTPMMHGQAPAPAAPVWTMITAENSTVAVTLPAGTTYRFGDNTNNLWSASTTVNTATTFSPVSFPAGVFPFADPDPGTVKEIDVLGTAATQYIAVTNLAVSPAVTVSQVVPPVLPPSGIDLPAGTAHTLTFTNFTVAPGGTQNALMFAFVNEPPSQASLTWEGTQMNLTIDGVMMVCTYGQTYSTGIFSLSCTVPATSTTASTTKATAATP